MQANKPVTGNNTTASWQKTSNVWDLFADCKSDDQVLLITSGKQERTKGRLIYQMNQFGAMLCCLQHKHVLLSQRWYEPWPSLHKHPNMLTLMFEVHQKARCSWSFVISMDHAVILRQLPPRTVISLTVLVDRSINISAACRRDLHLLKEQPGEAWMSADHMSYSANETWGWNDRAEFWYLRWQVLKKRWKEGKVLQSRCYQMPLSCNRVHSECIKMKLG